MDVRAAAAELGVSPSAVYQLVRAGRLAHARIGAGRGVIRIAAADLAAYLDSCRVEATGPAGRPAAARRRAYAGPTPKERHVLKER